MGGGGALGLHMHRGLDSTIVALHTANRDRQEEPAFYTSHFSVAWLETSVVQSEDGDAPPH